MSYAAATLVHTTCRAWQQWEAGDRRMHLAFWELFLLKSRSVGNRSDSDAHCLIFVQVVG